MYNLYLVSHPIGELIAVAKNEDDLRKEYGTRSTWVQINVTDIIQRRAEGKSERIFLAV